MLQGHFLFMFFRSRTQPHERGRMSSVICRWPNEFTHIYTCVRVDGHMRNSVVLPWPLVCIRLICCLRTCVSMCAIACFEYILSHRLFVLFTQPRGTHPLANSVVLELIFSVSSAWIALFREMFLTHLFILESNAASRARHDLLGHSAVGQINSHICTCISISACALTEMCEVRALPWPLSAYAFCYTAIN